MTLANYLYALVYSDIYDEKKWQMWAQKLLLDAEYDDNTEWVFEVFLQIINRNYLMLLLKECFVRTF
ncbi:MAG: hypothetical protein K2I10_10780 [Lachnospiraceae bacterium]|nr:hypothetical protein [Lachnospiraceae bacterium]